MSDIKKVVLAYSGGLDTSVILKWLKETYNCEVVTFTANLGQDEDYGAVEKKAKQQGVKEIFIEDLGIKLENVTIDMLGVAKRIVVDKENTTIVQGVGKKKDIEGRCNQIRAQIEETSSDYDKEKLQERLAKLAGGFAVIKVGGATEVEEIGRASCRERV